MRTTFALTLAALGALSCADRRLVVPVERPSVEAEAGDEDATDGVQPAEAAGVQVPQRLPETPEERFLRDARQALAAELAQKGIQDPAVLEAIRTVPRHEFLPGAQRPFAYEDRPLPIGHGQTIGPPYRVALMTEFAEVGEGDRVLEVGTGSGYQAAVLAAVGAVVYTVEIREPLSRRAKETFERLGYADRIHARTGDVYRGWPSQAPFDAIVVSAAPPEVPEPLLAQLARGGRMVMPVGGDDQALMVITRTEEGYERERVLPVSVVPTSGEAAAARAGSRPPGPPRPGRAASGA